MDEVIKLCVEDYIKNLLITKFKISNIKHSLEFAILYKLVCEYLVYKIGMYANYLYNLLKKKVNKKTFYYTLKKLAKKNIISLEKRDGLLFVELANEHKKAIINLIYQMQKSNFEFEVFLNEIEDLRASKIKKIAVERYKDVIELKPNQIYEITQLFNLYMQKTDETFLFFKRIGVEEWDFEDCGDIFEFADVNKDKCLLLPYKTRFDRLYLYVNKLRDLIKNATKEYDYAFFITLTFKRDKKLLEINKEIRKAWDRLRAYFRKILGGDMKFIKIHEFHISGYPHLHILVFSNKKWLVSQRKLSKIWEKYGMGKIAYIYLLKKNGDSYTWFRHKPKDCRSNDISNYLTKYFRKVFNDENNWQLALFWLTGLRFFTYSYKLSNKCKTDDVKVKKWEFVGVFDDYRNLELLRAFLIKNKVLKKYKYRHRHIYTKDWITPIAGMIEPLWIG